MAAKAAELQREVRENAEDYQNYLKDLYSWEKDIKIKDENLTNSSNSSNHKLEEFPIRNKKTVSSLSNEVSTSSTSEQYDLSNHQNKQKAMLEKNQGNQFFKEGKYEQAIAHYSEAMSLDPNDAILPANRAIAYIKLNKFEDAEKDCNRSISLDPTFVKAYHRRGTSRANTGKFELAIEDFEKVLSIEPHNKAALQELERLLNSKERSVKDVAISSKLTSGEEKSGRGLPAVITHQTPHRPRVDLSLDHPLLNQVEKLFPISNSSKYEPKYEVTVLHVKDTKQEGLGIHNLLKKNTEKKIPEDKTLKAEAHNSFGAIPAVPKTYIQFENDWTKMKTNTLLQYEYLKQITPSKLPEIFRESLETDILAGILKVLKTEYVVRNDTILPLLSGLSRVKRIGAVTMFLLPDQKKDLEFLLEYVASKSEGTEEERKLVFLKLS